jgi:flagellar biosynthetic protein FliQ
VGEIFLETASRGIQTALTMAAPILGLSLLAGFLISIFQAVTSIQEQTLTFVPKIFITGLALTVFAPFLFRTMNSFATELFGNLHLYIR